MYVIDIHVINVFYLFYGTAAEVMFCGQMKTGLVCLLCK